MILYLANSPRWYLCVPPPALAQRVLDPPCQLFNLSEQSILGRRLVVARGGRCGLTGKVVTGPAPSNAPASAWAAAVSLIALI